MQTSRGGLYCCSYSGGSYRTVDIQIVEPDSPFLHASGTQPPLTSRIFLTEMEAPAQQRGFHSPLLLTKSRTEVSTGSKAPLLAKASAHSLPLSCLGKCRPLRKLQALKGPTILKGKANSGL